MRRARQDQWRTSRLVQIFGGVADMVDCQPQSSSARRIGLHEDDPRAGFRGPSGSSARPPI
eukprot:5394513-Pyramimonas_sp.AAC.1